MIIASACLRVKMGLDVCMLLRCDGRGRTCNILLGSSHTIYVYVYYVFNDIECDFISGTARMEGTNLHFDHWIPLFLGKWPCQRTVVTLPVFINKWMKLISSKYQCRLIQDTVVYLCVAVGVGWENKLVKAPDSRRPSAIFPGAQMAIDGFFGVERVEAGFNNTSAFLLNILNSCIRYQITKYKLHI